MDYTFLDFDAKEGMLTGCAVIDFHHGVDRIVYQSDETTFRIFFGSDWWTGWGVFVNDTLVGLPTSVYSSDSTALGVTQRPSAGIKAPDFIKDIAGLETNRINQLVVKDTLQTTRDDDIFVIGDLAQCTQADGSFVPPRAQAAHQMASCAFSNIIAKLNGREPKAYEYKDKGSLVSLSRFSTVGSLMGNLTKGSMMVEGRIARVVYISLYRMHQVALHGFVKTGLMMLVGRINRVLRPNLKLH